tara:strand:+ start:1176 stop:1838 length:663 start_codon:yes stop_codon:yes gene_type:complete
LKYILLIFSVAITALIWVGEQWLAQYMGENFSSFPWGWIFFVTLSFFFGFILSDILNDNSAIRLKLIKAFKIAEIDHFVLASDSDAYEARLKFHFKRHFKNVRCSIKITQYVGVAHAQKDFITKQDVIKFAEPNLEHIIIVATYPKKIEKLVAATNPYWGEDRSKSWAGDGNHIVTLKLRAFIFTQTEKFLISTIRNFSTGPEPVLLFGDMPSNEYMQIN